MANTEENYSPYLAYESLAVHILALFCGFTFTAITILLFRFPDISQLHLQITLFFLTFLFDLLESTTSRFDIRNHVCTVHPVGLRLCLETFFWTQQETRLSEAVARAKDDWDQVRFALFPIFSSRGRALRRLPWGHNASHMGIFGILHRSLHLCRRIWCTAFVLLSRASFTALHDIEPASTTVNTAFTNEAFFNLQT